MDKRHGRICWSDSTKTDMGQIDKYDTLKDLGKDPQSPVGYNNIWVNLVYDVNHYGLHKARLVSDAHLTDI